MNVKHRKELSLIKFYDPGKPINDIKKKNCLDRVAKLDSNENTYGFSPRVRKAIEKAMDEINLYPDGYATQLRKAISYKMGLPENMILPSSGADEMLDLIAKSFIDKGDKVLMADVTFPRYFITSQMMGADIQYIPLKNMAYDIDGFIDSITNNVKIVWLCNPNNPTGTIFSEKEFCKLLEHIPATTLVVYDEAYAEYVTTLEYPRNLESLIKKYENLMVLKTLSKAYGLAGIRLGYAVAQPKILSAINKLRNTFNVSIIAQAAGIAALSDDDFVKKSVKNNHIGKEYIYSEFDKLGIDYVKTEANFMVFNSKMNSLIVFEKLLRKGVIIRPVGGFSTDTWLRVTIGTMEENSMFISALKGIYQ